MEIMIHTPQSSCQKDFSVFAVKVSELFTSLMLMGPGINELYLKDNFLYLYKEGQAKHKKLVVTTFNSSKPFKTTQEILVKARDYLRTLENKSISVRIDNNRFEIISKFHSNSDKRKSWEEFYGIVENPTVSWEEYKRSWVWCEDCKNWFEGYCSECYRIEKAASIDIEP